jgi:hypothetical protein
MRSSQEALEPSKHRCDRYKSGQLEGNCGRRVSVRGLTNVKYSRSLRKLLRPLAGMKMTTILQ